MCNACNILVGKAIGAGDIELGKRYAKQFMALAPDVRRYPRPCDRPAAAPLITSLFDLSDARRPKRRARCW
ncbi:MAG: hypothetical protein R2912_12750 [Eubacteriales bacterium]